MKKFVKGERMMKRIIMILMMVVMAAAMAFGAPESIEGDWMSVHTGVDYEGKLITFFYRFIDGNMLMLLSNPDSDPVYGVNTPYKYIKVGKKAFLFLELEDGRSLQYSILFSEDENMFAAYTNPNSQWTIYVKVRK